MAAIRAEIAASKEPVAQPAILKFKPGPYMQSAEPAGGDLLPCPFCGGEAFESSSWSDHFGCKDNTCAAYMASVARTKWNQRFRRTEAQERERFEAWLKRNFPRFIYSRTDGGIYTEIDTHRLWAAWRAALEEK
jgi:hypothetical protein